MTGFVGALLTPVTITGAGGSKDVESDYGAVGDGSTDDRTALNNAFAWVVGGANRTLNFGTGKTYKVGGSGTTPKVTLTGGNTFKIVGNGSYIKAANGSLATNGNSVIQFDGCVNFVVDALHIDGNRANRTPIENFGSNVFVTGGHGGSWLNCISKDSATSDNWQIEAPNNVSLDPTTFPYDMLFYQCTGDNSYRNNMSLIQGRNIQVLGGFYKLGSGTNPEGGIDLEPDAGPANDGLGILHNILIRGVTFDGNEGYGFAISRFVQNLTVEGCYFVGRPTATPTASYTKASGLHCVGQRSILIRKNTFENFGANYAGIDDICRVQSGFAEGTGDVVFDDNSFNSCQSIAGVGTIYEHSASGPGPIIFSNNRFYNCIPATTIYVGAPSWTTLTGNQVVGARTDGGVHVAGDPVPPWSVGSPPPPPPSADFFSIGGAGRSWTGAGTFTDVPFTTTDDVPAGADIIVAAAIGSSGDDGGVYSCTDTAGNSYTVEALVPSAGGRVLDAVILRARKVLALSAGETITPAWPVGQARAAAVAICAVGLADLAYDQLATAGGASTTPASGSITTTAAAEVILGFTAIRGPIADSYTADATFVDANARAGGASGGAADNATAALDVRVATDIETKAFAPTLGTSREWETLIISFELQQDEPTPDPIFHQLALPGMTGGING